MYEVDPVSLLAREVLRERAAALVAEACAWSVGLSDAPYTVRRHGRVVPGGGTLGARLETGLPLGGEEDARLDLADARPGSFADALNALTADGRLHADRFEQDVLEPFTLDTCVAAAERARDEHPAAWAELLDDLGEDGSDLAEVVRAAEWEPPLRIDVEHLVLAALADAPLLDVEAEGLPLSLVRAAEAELRAAVAPPPAERRVDDELAGALFLAEVALREAGLPAPVPPTEADRLLEVLVAEGLDEEEVVSLLPHLPVYADTADAVAERLANGTRPPGA